MAGEQSDLLKYVRRYKNMGKNGYFSLCMRPSKGKIVSVAVCLAIALAAAVFFLLAYPNHFFHREHYTLFLASGEFIRQMFAQGVYQPRQWMPTLAGEYLTQFYYYVGGGPAIVGVVLLLLGLVAMALARRLGAGWLCASSVAAVVMLWEAGRQCVGAYPLSSSLSLLMGGGLALLYPSRCGMAWRRYVAAVVICGVGLTSLGYGGAVPIAYIIVTEGVRRRWVMAIVGVVALAFVPYGGFRGGCWVGFPNMTSEAILRVDVKSCWGRALTEDDYPASIRNTQIANSLYTLSQIRQKGDAALDDVNWANTQLFIPVNEKGSYLGFTAAGEVWYSIGDMTMAEHSTILGMIFSPAHAASRHVKRLAEIALVRGDDAAAAKYLRILSHTATHGAWAAARSASAIPLRISELRTLMPQSDTLRASADYGRSLRNLLNNNANNALARTYLLALDLQQKRMRNFVEDYLRYGKGIMTRTYAEALMVVAATAPDEIKARLEGVALPPDVWRDFVRFNELMERGDVATLRREFAGSYWLFFQKISDSK